MSGVTEGLIRNIKKESIRHAEYIKTPKGRFAAAKTETKKKHRRRKTGISWGLTFEDWWSLVGPDKCYYCEGPLPKAGVGLDRIEPALGYIKGNVVPCCRWNNLERGILSFDEYCFIINRRKDRWKGVNLEQL